MKLSLTLILSGQAYDRLEFEDFDRLRIDDTHPFTRYRPAKWDVHAWGTRTRDLSMQEHHIHQHAWLSGRSPSSGSPGSGRTHSRRRTVVISSR